MTANHAISTVEADPGYGQLLSALVRQRFWAIGVFCVVVAIATAYSFKQKPIYQSSMQLLVEPNYQSKKDSNNPNQFADSTVEIDNSTQLAQMRSSQLLQKAVALLKHDYPTLTVAALQGALTLTQLEEDKVKTKIFQVSYTDTDPEKTRDILLSIQKVYQDYNREQQQQRLSRGLEFIDQQIPQVQKQVRSSEDALETFRRSRNLVDPEAQSKALIDALSKVRQDRQTNIAQLRDAQARYAKLQQQLKLAPQQALTSSRLSQSARFQNLLNEIQKTELDLAKARTMYTDSSPVVQKLLDQRQQKQALLDEGTKQVLGNDADQVAEGKALLSQGQLGTTDQTLATNLAEVQTNLAELTERSKTLAQTERSLTADLDRFPHLLASYGRLQPNVEIRRATFQQLLKARQDLALEIARGGFDWQVVEQPKIGTKIGPKTTQNLLLGIVAGLMLGGVTAFVRDGIDDAVRTSDELTKQFSLPLLGMVPEKPDDTRSTFLQIPFHKPDALIPSGFDVFHWQPFRESMDLLYKNIQLLPAIAGLKSLVITSALAGEGKSTLALGLAISAARSNQRVLLIDADLRRPSLHVQLNLANDQGLSTLLAKPSTLLDSNSIQPAHLYTDLPLSVLTAGPTPIDPARLLSSDRLQTLLALFEQTYDLVILDAPPVLGIVDAIAIASSCWGVLLVARMGQVSQTDFTQAAAMLNTLNVIGVVANGLKDVANPYLAYGRKS